MVKITYKNLWKRLAEENINKSSLCKRARLAPSTMAKMTNNKQVSLNTIMKICNCLDCNIGDVITVYKDDEEEERKKKLLLEGLTTLKKICDDQKKEKLSNCLELTIEELEKSNKKVL